MPNYKVQVDSDDETAIILRELLGDDLEGLSLTTARERAKAIMALFPVQARVLRVDAQDTIVREMKLTRELGLNAT